MLTWNGIIKLHDDIYWTVKDRFCDAFLKWSFDCQVKCISMFIFFVSNLEAFSNLTLIQLPVVYIVIYLLFIFNTLISSAFPFSFPSLLFASSLMSYSMKGMTEATDEMSAWWYSLTWSNQTNKPEQSNERSDWWIPAFSGASKNNNFQKCFLFPFNFCWILKDSVWMDERFVKEAFYDR